MTALTIQDASQRSGLSEPTLRYYEEVGLIGPITRHAEANLQVQAMLPSLEAMVLR